MKTTDSQDSCMCTTFKIYKLFVYFGCSQLEKASSSPGFKHFFAHSVNLLPVVTDYSLLARLNADGFTAFV